MTTYLVTTLSMDFSVHPADRVQALPADYCEFRLCMTPADYVRRQRHRAKPIPLPPASEARLYGGRRFVFAPEKSARNYAV